MIYYNDIDKDNCAWLAELMRRGLIAPGEIDDRSIELVQPGDVAGYTQCHFFSGIGVWSHAARLAGWPDDRPLWTGSCPCQPFSVSGKRRGTADRRHLWPHLFRLVSACRPPVVMGEQVAKSLGWNWFNGVRADLAGAAYQCRGLGLCSCAVDSPDERERIYWCAVADRDRDQRVARSGNDRGETSGAAGTKPGDRRLRVGPGRRDDPGAMAHHVGHAAERREGPDERDRHGGHAGSHAVRAVVDGARLGRGEGEPEPDILGWRYAAAGTDARRALGHGDRQGLSLGSGLAGDAREERPAAERADDPPLRNGSWYAGAEWIECHDGQARRAQPGTPMLVAGFRGRIPMWRGLGGSVNAQLAKEVIQAFMETEGRNTT